MRAVQAQEFGGPEVLKRVELDPPEPAVGAAVVAVHAVDVLGLDIAIRSGDAAESFGVAPPYVPGDGVAGTVVAVGDGVDRQLVGRRVVTTTGTQGAYAERVAVSAEDLVTVPDGLRLAAAAALVHDGRTALALIEAAAIRPGERVLVVPAGSGLGLMLVQLARLAGGTVVAAARGAEQLAAATAAGATRVVDAASSDWTVQLGESVDVVLDGVGEATGCAAFEVIASGGRYLSYSGKPGPEPDEARRRDVTLFGTEVVHLGSSGATRRLTERVLGEAAAGRVRPVIGSIFPLEDAAEAHAAFERGGLVGRTLITAAEVDAMAGHDELIGLVERFSQGFAAADAELLTGLWAGDEEVLVYVAGERARPLRTRGEIARYYRETLDPVGSVDTAEVTDLSVEAAGDRGRVFFRFRFAGREAASDERFEVDIRITAIARRRDDQWVLVHYHESSPGPV
ncbi:zinc-binding dehydrogenase [Actinopolyspora saharensis]|uniref:NADPH:quinone reductase n=1 Tax=Actinopolyspora saharensis TaxID=995062 RepID=A0A1H0ZNN8_9ACTN|nr:zinc-binding dehydrogenase [Actinopolyspora saharensis]SDQ28656.1 NADPH:quinone reductase [Actinopolyspora saharensis]